MAMAVSAASLNAQPTVASVVNIASYAVSGLPNAAIAQGALFAVFGTNMGPTTIQFAAGFPLPTNLMGTTITVTTSTTSAQAPIIYTSAGQLAAVFAVQHARRSRDPDGGIQLSAYRCFPL